MFIFPVSYFSLILNPEIKIHYSEKPVVSKYRYNNGEEIFGRGFF